MILSMKYSKIFPFITTKKDKIIMAKISQLSFSWESINSLGDLERLVLVLENINDERLIQIIERKRKNGRNDYPVKAVWNCIIAGIIFQHSSIESLIRELKRNAQLRQICGLDVCKGIEGVPPSYVFSRFMTKLTSYQKLIDDSFNTIVNSICKLLPDFGENIAGDGKAISSLAKNKNKNSKRDGRRDLDASFGTKKYKGINPDGTPWSKTVSWFGYKLHLLVDSKYELPIAYEVTKASQAETPTMKELITKLNKLHPSITEACNYAYFDKGYDDKCFIKTLWDEYGIKPVIDIRNMWKDKEKTRLLLKYNNVVHDFKGTISCYCPISFQQREMAFGGFENNRNTLKYICPAKAYGIDCIGKEKCLANVNIRVPLDVDRRIFTPVARSSYKWSTLYKNRTSVERVNSRLDVSFGFENHNIRGLKKMKLKCSLALNVMLSLALGRCKENKMHLMRSLVKVA